MLASARKVLRYVALTPVQGLSSHDPCCKLSYVDVALPAPPSSNQASHTCGYRSMV